jgi:hypothetical protein
MAGHEWLTMARKLGVGAVLKVSAGGTATATPEMKARLKIEVPDLKLELAE